MKMGHKGLFLAAITVAALASASGLAIASDEQREIAAGNFLQADADGDGQLTLDEFTVLIDLNAESDIGRSRLVRRLGRYETAFGRVDANVDGLLTVEEMQAAAEANR